MPSVKTLGYYQLKQRHARNVMKILALELSTARGSIFSLDADADASAALKTSFAREWANDRKHSGTFFENLQSATKELGAAEKIIVGLGPGSYAGTRIAISAAIGLQIASGAVLVGLSSICAMEYDGPEYCVIGDARSQSLFFARIRANHLIVLSEAELKKKLDTLDNNMSIFCSEPLPQFERAALRYPSAKILAKLARDPHRAFLLPPLEPMYLREPHITLPRSTIVS
jgi:tRNA threonylcarbamoyl adenosine modification protein YeaZ